MNTETAQTVPATEVIYSPSSLVYKKIQEGIKSGEALGYKEILGFIEAEESPIAFLTDLLRAEYIEDIVVADFVVSAFEDHCEAYKCSPKARFQMMIDFFKPFKIKSGLSGMCTVEEQNTSIAIVYFMLNTETPFREFSLPWLAKNLKAKYLNNWFELDAEGFYIDPRQDPEEVIFGTNLFDVLIAGNKYLHNYKDLTRLFKIVVCCAKGSNNLNMISWFSQFLSKKVAGAYLEMMLSEDYPLEQFEVFSKKGNEYSKEMDVKFKTVDPIALQFMKLNKYAPAIFQMLPAPGKSVAAIDKKGDFITFEELINWYSYEMTGKDNFVA